jgi:hypothetical protein
MPKESEFWRDDVTKLKAFGLIERIEEAMRAGVSDCVYALRWPKSNQSHFGWIELKRLLYWPSRSTSAVRLPHFTLDQVNFLERWGRAGAGAYLLAQVSNEYCLFTWRHVRAIHDGRSRIDFLALCAVHGVGAFPAGRILRCLTEVDANE